MNKSNFFNVFRISKENVDIIVVKYSKTKEPYALIAVTI